MAIVTENLREIQFDDGVVAKFNEGETLDEVTARLEAMGLAVNVF